MTSDVQLTIEYRTRLARTWVRACALLSHVVGERATRWAQWGAMRFVRWRIVAPRFFAGQRWRRLGEVRQ